MNIEEHLIEPSRPFPNNVSLPLRVFRQAVDGGECSAAWFERRFSLRGWGGSWRNGVYSFHHYHSTAHEALGCYAGFAAILFGGPDGITAAMRAGEAVLVPAGVGHCLLEASEDFAVVGAYPGGFHPDLLRGDDAIYEAAVARIAVLPTPPDPI